MDTAKEAENSKTRRKNKKNRVETLIYIDENYSLGADWHSWHIIKRVNRNGKPTDKWRPVKWYATLDGALDGLLRLKLRISEVKTLVELQKEQRKILAELSETFYLYIDGSSCRSKIKAGIIKAFNNKEIPESCVKSLFSLLKLGEV